MKPMNLEDTIESLVDKHSLDLVLGALSRVCQLKADHIQTNWQDPILADTWSTFANRIADIATDALDANIGGVSRPKH